MHVQDGDTCDSSEGSHEADHPDEHQNLTDPGEGEFETDSVRRTRNLATNITQFFNTSMPQSPPYRESPRKPEANM